MLKIKSLDNPETLPRSLGKATMQTNFCDSWEALAGCVCNTPKAVKGLHLEDPVFNPKYINVGCKGRWMSPISTRRQRTNGERQGGHGVCKVDCYDQEN